MEVAPKTSRGVDLQDVKKEPISGEIEIDFPAKLWIDCIACRNTPVQYDGTFP